MTAGRPTLPPNQHGAFRHEAFLYSGDADFMAGSLGFLHAGLANDEAMLVVLGQRKIQLLREALGVDADRVQFADMATVGANPARIIPAWRRFVDEQIGNGRAGRGIGEPIWAERSDAELVQCQHHESLLNVAFANTDWILMCPYDTRSLAPGVIELACLSHPYLLEGLADRHNPAFDEAHFAGPYVTPLTDAPVDAPEIGFCDPRLAPVRMFVEREAMQAGLEPHRVADLVLAVNELATNSLRHGGGDGHVRAWRESGAVVCEVRDRGHLKDPLLGRRLPAHQQHGGRGLWLVNHLCDLVQIRSSDIGTTVRLHMYL
jgi:anti-sigma regulatory factor (Ser/Thr protein kinase)